MKGAVIEEIVLADNLTSKQAYKLEHRHLERLVYAGNREQLWNAIPPSIYTPQVSLLIYGVRTPPTVG
jgi:hypothetical protein